MLNLTHTFILKHAFKFIITLSLLDDVFRNIFKKFSPVFFGFSNIYLEILTESLPDGFPETLCSYFPFVLLNYTT